MMYFNSHYGHLVIVMSCDENESDSAFPSISNENCGHWVGFVEDKGDQLTLKILTEETESN